MINEMGLAPDRIVINPTIGGLGYGIEYAYSIMERARLAALNGDAMLSMPFVCFVGHEAWRAKEARIDSLSQKWGDASIRGPMWEAQTAATVLMAGAGLLIMRHPKAVESVRGFIDTLMKR
jgi:acetyl-CoA decarbonylase/synthase complex subunit delta